MSLVQLPDLVDADCDLFLRVRDLLHQRGYEPLRTLEICVERGVVIVQGTLSAYYLRQVAVECIRRVAGVDRFIDRIEVVYLHDNCTVNDGSISEPKTSTKPTEPRSDWLDMERAAEGESSFHFQGRRQLASAK
ncbi:MAG: BON domain-containing protein [Pirellulaceae bacterium]|nr:BON domain-containing protein [Pirellulaceae bacterium]